MSWWWLIGIIRRRLHRCDYGGAHPPTLFHTTTLLWTVVTKGRPLFQSILLHKRAASRDFCNRLLAFFFPRSLPLLRTRRFLPELHLNGRSVHRPAINLSRLLGGRNCPKPEDSRKLARRVLLLAMRRKDKKGDSRCFEWSRRRGSSNLHHGLQAGIESRGHRSICHFQLVRCGLNGFLDAI